MYHDAAAADGQRIGRIDVVRCASGVVVDNGVVADPYDLYPEPVDAPAALDIAVVSRQDELVARLIVDSSRALVLSLEVRDDE